MPEVASLPSAQVCVKPSLVQSWLKDPLRPERNVAVSCVAGITLTRARQQAVLEGLDRVDPIVQTGVRRSRRGQVTVTPMTPTEAAAVDALLDAPAVLLLQQPAEAEGWPGLSLYFAVTGDDAAAPVGQASIPQRDVTFGITEVRAPR